MKKGKEPINQSAKQTNKQQTTHSLENYQFLSQSPSNLLAHRAWISPGFLKLSCKLWWGRGSWDVQGLSVPGGRTLLALMSKVTLSSWVLSLPPLIFPGKEDLGSCRRIPTDKAYQEMANFRSLRCLGWTGIILGCWPELSEAAEQATMRAGVGVGSWGTGCIWWHGCLSQASIHKQQSSTFS